MPQKFLISFCPGTGGNLIAGLIYCMATNKPLTVMHTGSVHHKKLWLKTFSHDLTVVKDSEFNISITHEWIDNYKIAALDNVTIIQIKYLLSSKPVIQKLSVNKNIDALIEIIREQHPNLDRAALIDHVYAHVDKDIDNFFINNNFNCQLIHFEDIWDSPNKLLEDLSSITKLPINKNAAELLESYRQTNARLYNINLTSLHPLLT